MALEEDEEDCLPEPWAARLAMERVTRIFSVRIREVVVIECIAEDICGCESAKQKVIQEGHLELDGRGEQLKNVLFGLDPVSRKYRCGPEVYIRA
jgi:hypothetical protein